jgi:hypothetical protein
VKDALDELYAKIDGILKTISLESLTDQSCIDFVPTGDELTATDVLCHIWQGLDEAEILIGELEALSGAWDGDSCRRG